MQGDINSLSGHLAVGTEEPTERIKRRGRVRIQERVAQPRLADLAYGQVLPLVPGITETRFPVPSLEIIAKFAHLTAKPGVKQSIPVSYLVTPGTGVVNAAEPNAGSDRNRDSVNEHSRVRYCERIKRILDRYADAARTKSHVSACNFEWIRP